jgi:hypothetical protein
MTLIEISYYSRKFLPVGIILILVIAIIGFGVQLLFLYFNSQSTSQTAPSVQQLPISPLFDRIQPPTIPEARSPSAYTFVLDTFDATANPEQATSAAHVYFIPQKTASFGFLSKIYLMAQASGFDTKITQHKLEDKMAVFDDGKRTLRIDIRNFNFEFDYKLTQNDPLGLAPESLTEQTIISTANTYLNGMNRYPSDFSAGDTNVIYLAFNPDTKQVNTVEKIEQANIAEVDYYLPDLNGYPVVTSSYYNSPHFVMVLLSGGEQKVIQSTVAYLDRSIDQIGIYPLKTPQQAWEELESGKGYVVSAKVPEGEVIIKKVFMGYYDPDVYQEYVQPVYVFLGENEFVAYVSAVTSEYLIE